MFTEEDIKEPGDFVRAGIPFLEGGRTLAGLDCWGLYWMASRLLLGREFASFSGTYKTKLDFLELQHLIENERDLNWRPVWEAKDGPRHAREEEFGDGVLLRMRGRRCHCAFVLEGKKMLHIDSGSEVTIERYDDFRWRDLIVGVYRHAAYDV